MKIKTVLNGHVLLRPRAKEAVAGIEIPDTVDKERPTLGTVVVGNEVLITKDDRENAANLYLLGAGDLVIFNAFSPRKVVHEGEECLLVNGDDIYAVIEE